MRPRKYDIFCFTLCIMFTLQLNAWAEPKAWTYSIVAWDEAHGEMGVAVQSHWFSCSASLGIGIFLRIC